MNNTTKGLKRILEYLWLTISVVAMGIAIKETIKIGFTESLIYYIFIIIAVFFYFLRRKERLGRQE